MKQQIICALQDSVKLKKGGIQPTNICAKTGWGIHKTEVNKIDALKWVPSQSSLSRLVRQLNKIYCALNGVRARNENKTEMLKMNQNHPTQFNKTLVYLGGWDSVNKQLHMYTFELKFLKLFFQSSMIFWIFSKVIKFWNLNI